MALENKPSIHEISRLLTDGRDLSPDDIGTDRDIGSVGTTADYDDLPDEEGLETFAGVAWAMAGGSLANASQRGLTVRKATMDLVDRALARFGSLDGAFEHLSFVPTDKNDEFEGARLELVGQYLVGYNGSDGRQIKRSIHSRGDLARALVAIGSFVLKGMIQSLSRHSTHLD